MAKQRESEPARLMLVEVHARLFPEDVQTLRGMAAANGVSVQIELRQLVRRALKGERREVLMIKEQ